MQAVKTELSEDDPLLEEKIELLGKESGFQPYRLTKSFEDKSFEELLATIRFILAGHEHLEALKVPNQPNLGVL